MNEKIEFPSTDEYPSYTEMYMKWVKKDGSLIKKLEDSLSKTQNLIASLSEQELNFRYRYNKWSNEGGISPHH